MADLSTLLQTLSEKTSQGRVPWRKAAGEHTVTASVAGGMSFELYSDPSAVGITTRDAAGETVPGLSTPKLGAFMPNQVLLSELALAAFRIASEPGDHREEEVLTAVREL